MAGCLEKSTEVMKSMQELVKVKDIALTMREMSKEMMRVRSLKPDCNLCKYSTRCCYLLQAGLIEEMMEDSMAGLEEPEELEEEAQEEVDKVLWEITAGQTECAGYSIR